MDTFFLSACLCGCTIETAGVSCDSVSIDSRERKRRDAGRDEQAKRAIDDTGERRKKIIIVSDARVHVIREWCECIMCFQWVDGSLISEAHFLLTRTERER